MWISFQVTDMNKPLLQNTTGEIDLIYTMIMTFISVVVFYRKHFVQPHMIHFPFKKRKPTYVAATILLARPESSNQTPPFVSSTTATTSTDTAKIASCPSGCRTPLSLWWVPLYGVTFISKHSLDTPSWVVPVLFILPLWFRQEMVGGCLGSESLL